jgi:hypothetical protein
MVHVQIAEWPSMGMQFPRGPVEILAGQQNDMQVLA